MDKALALKPDSSKVLAAASTVSWMDGEYEEARQLAKRAIAIDADDPEALWALYLAYWDADDWGSSFDIIKKLLTVEPLSPNVLLSYGSLLIRSGYR